jgi:hypothetical protein
MIQLTREKQQAKELSESIDRRNRAEFLMKAIEALPSIEFTVGDLFWLWGRAGWAYWGVSDLEKLEAIYQRVK